MPLTTRRFVCAVLSSGLALALVLLALPTVGLFAAGYGPHAAWLLTKQQLGTGSPEDALRLALARTRAAGTYRFHADVHETLLPRAGVANIGRQERAQDLQADGAVVPGRALVTLTLPGPRSDQTPAVRILSAGGQTFRVAGDQLTAIDAAASLIGPTSDIMDYPAAASRVTDAGWQDTAAGRVHRYRFDLDGVRFAERLGRRLSALATDLPPGVALAVPPAFRQLTGSGEFWVDEAGLPRRQIIDMFLPGLNPSDDATVRLVADFDAIGGTVSVPDAVPGPDGTWRLVANPDAGTAALRGGFGAGTLPTLGGLAFVALAGAWSWRQRGRRHAYATMVAVTCFSLVGGPLLRAWDLNQFFQARAALAQAAPVAPAASADPFALNGVHSATTGLAGAGPTRSAPTLGGPAGVVPVRRCSETNPAGQDSDNDGLSDAYEGCLGTDPENPDSDGDLINDRRELTGIADAKGRVWTSDPLRPDSNGDGLLDRVEWPQPFGGAPALDIDSDGLPNVWDDDNDGDGVGDGVDLSPNATLGWAPTFQLTTARPTTDTLDARAYQIVEIAVQPQAANHLRYSLGQLDWPHDELGQIQVHVDPSLPIRLVPLLEIKTDVAPSLGGRYGVVVGPNHDADGATLPYLAYLPLQPVLDGGAVGAFVGSLAYTPAEAARVRWSAQLVWTVQGNLDYWQTCPGATREGSCGTERRPTLVHKYTEPAFRVTGLNIVKSQRDEVAIFTAPQRPANDAFLFQLALGLNATWMVSTTQTLASVVAAFRSPTTPLPERFGVNTALAVLYSGDRADPAAFAYRDMAWTTTTQTMTVQALNAGFQPGDAPTLAFAFQEDTGAAGLGSAAVSVQAAAATVNLAAFQMLTTRSVKLVKYGWAGVNWAPLSLADAARQVEAALPGGTDAERFLAALTMTCLGIGQTNIVAVDGVATAESAAKADAVDAAMPVSTVTTLQNWVNRLAQAAQVGDGDSLITAMRKMSQYSLDNPVFLLTSGFALVFTILLGGLVIIAWATGNQSLQSGVTWFNNAVSGLDAAYALISNVVSAIRARNQLVNPTLDGLKEVGTEHGGIAENIQVGDDMSVAPALEEAGDAAEAVLGFAKLLGVVGAVIAVTAVVIVTAVIVFTHLNDPDAIGLAVATAAAAIIVIVGLFLLALIPEIGEVLVAVIVLLDIEVQALTVTLLGRDISLLGLLQQDIAYVLYNVRPLVVLADQTTTNYRGTILPATAGVTDGAQYVMQTDVLTTLGEAKGATSANVAASSAFAQWACPDTIGADCLGQYLSTDPADRYIEQCGSPGVGDCRNNPALAFRLHAGRNADLEIFRGLTYRLEELAMAFGYSWIKTRSGTVPDPSKPATRADATTSVYLDVLPATPDDLWYWWPALSNEDVDADGLSFTTEVTLGTSDAQWDSDADSLSDGFEVQGAAGGLNPKQADADGDGLPDNLERRFGTSPAQADSDADGLSDGAEVCRFTLAAGSWSLSGGWDARIPDGPQVHTIHLCSDPTRADADGDGYSDAQEQANTTSPFAANSGRPQLTLGTSPQLRGPGGQGGTYVAPSGAVTVDLNLTAEGGRPVTSTLSVCLPGDLVGLRFPESPPRAIALQACGPTRQGSRLDWSYTPGAPLPGTGELNAQILAYVDKNLPSHVDTLVATLPFSATEVTATAQVVVDADNPLVTLTDPPAGAALRGQRTVVGGTASDATGWVESLALDLGQNLPSGQWTRVLTDTAALGRWSTEWTLPSQDGSYVLRAQATDEVRHTSEVTTRSVVVDNTPPTVAIATADVTGVGGHGTLRVVGTAGDNLSGLVRAQVSVDGAAWVTAIMTPAIGAPLAVAWLAVVPLPAGPAHGQHSVAARSVDVAGNTSVVANRTVAVDTIPPLATLSEVLDGLPTNRSVTLRGHVDDTGNLPPAPVPARLSGELDALADATVWLQADEPAGPTTGAAWLGDMNGDGRDDLAVGSPTGAGGTGRVAVLFGRADGWTVPRDVQPLAADGSSFVGAPGAGLGSQVAAAGDVDGDGFPDLLIGDPANRRLFLVYGGRAVPGRDVPLSGASPGWTVITAAGGPGVGAWQAAAGDVNRDGADDLLIGVTGVVGRAYLLLGGPARAASLDVATAAGALLPFPPSGAPLGGAGDMTGDGVADVIVADPGNAFGPAGANRPALYLFAGGAQFQSPGAGRHPVVLGPTAASATFTTGAGAIGQSVAPLGDVNGDGLSDLAYSGGLGVQLVLGRPGAGAWDVRTLPGSATAVTGVGDVNADGKTDLALTLPADQLQLVLGAAPFPSQPLAVATLNHVARVIGWTPASAADCNCDGAADLAVVPALAADVPLPSDGLLSALTRGSEWAPAAGPSGAARPSTNLFGWLGAVLAPRAEAARTVFVSSAYCPTCANDGHAWQVDGFSSIQAAIASRATRVLVGPGSYREAVQLADGVAVIGSGADATVIVPPASGAPVALVTAAGVTGAHVARLALAGDGRIIGVAVSGGSAEVTLSRLLIHNTGVAVALDGAGTGAQLVNDTLVDNGRGLVATGCAAVNVRNTLFARHAGAAMAYQRAACPGAAPLNRYNLFWRNGPDLTVDGATQDVSDAGRGQLVADPRFVDPGVGDFRVGVGSPAIDAGDVSDQPPPGTGARRDIGYVQSGQGALSVDAGYCAQCPNAGLDWQVDAFAGVGDALAAVRAIQDRLSCEASISPGLGCGVPLRVSVGPGTYREQVAVPGNVRLAGSGADQTTLAGPGSGTGVTVRDAMHVAVTGFRVTGFGSGAADAGIGVLGAASQVTVSYNLVVGDVAARSSCVAFGDTARGVAYNNTTVNCGNGLAATGSAARVQAVNNILANNAYGILAQGTGGRGATVTGAYNLFYGNTRNYATAGGYISTDPDLVNQDPQFVNPTGGDYHLQPGSVALGAGTPRIAGARGPSADLGYRGPPVVPLALFFGREGATCATANSGVAGVSVGLTRLTDLTLPITATRPSAWTTAALSVTGQTGTAWSVPLPAGDGAGWYRLYTQASDRAGNSEARLAATVLADSTIPHVSWVSPGAGAAITGAAVELVAQATDDVGVGGMTLSTLGQPAFRVDGQLVPAHWADAGFVPPAGVRPFHASVALGLGGHVLEALASNEAGTVGSAGTRTVQVTGSDVATLTFPASDDAIGTPGLTVQGVARFHAPGGVVQVYVDGQLAGTAQLSTSDGLTSGWTLAVTLAGEVTHTLKAAVGGASPAGAAAVAVRLDTTAPTLQVTAPSAAAVFRGPVTVRGQATDGGSGLAMVQLSTDGGLTWDRAVMTATSATARAWSYVWQPLTGTDDVVVPVLVRALDRAGNTFRVTWPVTVDNTPPAQPVALHIQWCPAGGTCADVVPGAVLATSGYLQVNYQPPILDGSGPVPLLMLRNTAGDAPPAPGEFKAVPSNRFNFFPTTPAADYFVHLAAKDPTGNMWVHTLGPYRYGTKPFGGAGTLMLPVGLAAAATWQQPITVDGTLDVAHGEWSTATEALDDDERSGTTQTLFATWDSAALYLGWQGAYWLADGTMFAYLETGSGGVRAPVSVGGTTLPALPFAADWAVQVDDAGQASAWRASGGAWQPANPTDLGFLIVHGQSGSTELRLPLAALGSPGALHLVAFQVRDDGRVASVFPTPNELDGPWDVAYRWATLDPHTVPNADQPSRLGAVMRLMATSVDGRAGGIGQPFDVYSAITNLEDEAVTGLVAVVQPSAGVRLVGATGATCADCPADGTWRLTLPPLPAHTTHPLTLTLSAAAGDTATVSGQVLDDRGRELARASRATAIDAVGPEVRLDRPASRTARSGHRLVTGAGWDTGGAGVARVELRVGDAAGWLRTVGTGHWSLGIEVPASGVLPIAVRARDVTGRVGNVLRGDILVDNVPPIARLDPPTRGADGALEITGTAEDPFPVDGALDRVEVQVDDGLWRTATRAGRQGTARVWRLRSALPWAVGTHQVRARAIDAAGNIGPATAPQAANVVASGADLGVTQNGPTLAAPGIDLTYRLRVENRGPATASATRLVDSLPGSVAVVSAPPACSQQGEALVCELGDLPAGATREIEFVGRLDPASTVALLRNTVTVFSLTPDPHPDDNRAVWTSRRGGAVFLPVVSAR